MDERSYEPVAELLKGSGNPGRALRMAGIASLAMAWSDRLAAWAGESAHEGDEQVTCGKGCAACCRELIPVSPAEAFSLHEHVHGRVAERRISWESRFRKSRSALIKAMESGAAPFHDPAAYFSLQLPCPFLEKESCTIHPRRPLACREHLVVSPAAHCSSFPAFSIRPLVRSPRVGEALFNLCGELLGRPPERIPLVSALAWADEHGEDGQREWEAGPVVTALAFHIAQIRGQAR